MSTERLIKSVTTKKPLILKSRILVKRDNLKNIKVLKAHITFQEDIVYVSKPGDMFSGEYLKVTIVNRLGTLTNTCRTIASCITNTGVLYEKTSDEITKIIGQSNYDILFSSLCSILSQELKIRGIWSLLTVPKTFNCVNCQTDPTPAELKSYTNESSQTDVTSMPLLKRFNTNRRNKRPQATPYVIKDDEKKPKKLIINPENFTQLLKKDTFSDTSSPVTELPELGPVFDEDSNTSVGRLSALSVTTTPELLTNPMNILLTNVDKHTKDIEDSIVKQEMTVVEPLTIHNLDTNTTFQPNQNEQVEDRVAPNNISSVDRMKLLLHQGLNDWKSCLVRDPDGYMPIHLAVLQNDAELLKRQCMVLKSRETSVDILADGMTPLKMSLFQDNVELTAILLENGADVLDTDDAEKTAIHIAAEKDTDHLQVLINYCERSARKILQENEDLWKQEYEKRSDLELAKILLRYINEMYDVQGYNPLMLASKLGKYNNVKTLIESSEYTINTRAPNSGNTALYLAVGAACMDSTERGNKAKVVDHFTKTIEILVENGADMNIENFGGTSVNDLLTEYNIGELSMLIANKITALRLESTTIKKCTEYMLFKDDDGKVTVTDFEATTLRKSRNVPLILETLPFSMPVGNSLLGRSITLPTTTQKSTGNSKKMPTLKKIAINKPLVLTKPANKRKSNSDTGPGPSKKSNTPTNNIIVLP